MLGIIVLMLVIKIEAISVSSESLNVDDTARHYNSRYSIYDDSYKVDFRYHNHSEMHNFLRKTSSRYPNLTALYSIGQSAQSNIYKLF